MRVSLFLLALSLLSSLSLSSAAAPAPSLYITSSVQDTADRLTPQAPVAFTTSRPSGDVLTVFPELQYQPILGFGGALTEAAAVTLQKLPASLQAEVINAYYNASSGHGYTWGRVPINSCDFTDESYNFDNVTDDFSLANFDTDAVKDSKTIIPLIKAAQAASSSGLRLFGTPWSPPGWMKENGQMDGSSLPCLKQDPKYQKAWALYYSKWFATYASFGIPFWGLTIQNEPENEGLWESCAYTAEQELAFFLDYLYPQLHSTHPQLNFMFYDHNKDHALNWARVFYTNTLARQLVWGLAIHWYSGDSFNNVRQIHDSWPDKPIMATEACNCNGPQYGAEGWRRGETYVHDILGDLNAFARGWTDWNILLDQQGGPNHVGNFCDAPLIADVTQSPPTLTYQPTYYAMGHFSRFLPEGSIRIGLQFTGGSPTLEWTAFLVYVGHGAKESWTRKIAHERAERDGVAVSGSEVVLVVFNPTDAAQPLTLQAGQYYVQVKVPAHSFHSAQFDASIFGDSAVVQQAIKNQQLAASE